jgi:hypothetical protein
VIPTTSLFLKQFCRSFADPGSGVEERVSEETALVIIDAGELAELLNILAVMLIPFWILDWGFWIGEASRSNGFSLRTTVPSI